MKITANGIDIAYDDHGDKDAPVILACHSLATNRAVWDAFVHELSDQYRIITPDARGHGQSDAPKGAYDFTALMNDVTGLMDALEISQVHYVGLSMGGFIGQHLGIHAPERIKTLTLSSTASQTPKAGQEALDGRIAQAEAGGMESLVDGTIDRWFTDDFQESHPQIIEPVEKMVMASPVAGFVGWCHAIKTLNLTRQLHKITSPTLLTVGDQDPGTPVAASQAIFNQLPEAEMVIFPESSHQHPLQYPFEYADLVRDLVDDYENPDKDIWDDEV